MKIYVTVRELIDRGLWDEYCEIKGINVWCVNEGQMTEDELVQVPDSMLRYFVQRY